MIETMLSVAASLVVMTFNLNYGLAGESRSIEAIRAANADVVVLQETNAPWETALRDALAGEYPHMEFRHCCNAGGLAILSKHPIAPAEVIPPVSWFPAWPVVIESPLGKVQILAVHLRPQLGETGGLTRRAITGWWTTEKIRRKEVEAFTKSLVPALPTMIAGDFNEDERGEAMKWLRKQGYANPLTTFSPTAKTWRWRTRLKTFTNRFDFILHDSRLKATSATVLHVGSSDHLPVVVTLEAAGELPRSSFSGATSPR